MHDEDEFTEDETWSDDYSELRYLHNGIPVRIRQEMDTEFANPRDNSNVGTFVHWHRSYRLGDEQISGQLDEAMERGGLRLLARYLKLVVGATVVIPVGLLDHSGLTVWAGGGSHWSDSAGWDSGTVGVIYDTPESRKDTGVPLDKVEEALRDEITEYDRWLRGEVYWYEVGDDDLESDSCGGYIGLEWAKEAANEAADYLADDYRRKQYMVACCRFDPSTLGEPVAA
jgi:hypothetical protein